MMDMIIITILLLYREYHFHSIDNRKRNEEDILFVFDDRCSFNDDY